MGGSRSRQSPAPATYPLRSAARLTGLSPELLRAWERRHAAVTPLRTPGGTRRYRASDLERLRLLKAATDAGHRIGALAKLSDAELERLARAPEAAPGDRLAEILDALDGLDAARVQRLLALQLSTLGPVAFAHELAAPLVHEIGERWAARRMRVASEHLATAALRSLLGSALQPGTSALHGARVLFATLEGERHELGLLMAALTAMGAGAHPFYLGPEVPVADLLYAASRTGASVVALSVVTTPASNTRSRLKSLRAGLPANVHLWVGGAGAGAIELPSSVEQLEKLAQLEQRVGLLAYEKPGPHARVRST